MISPISRTIIGTAALCAAGAAGADAAAPRVVELFTSHGCSSCPAADALFGELLAADPGLVGLEYHVDYWDSLMHGADGSFADPFSSPAWSARQRDYAHAGLAGRSGVYTPQAVVDGRVAAVGSDAGGIARALAEPAAASAMKISVEPGTDGRLDVAVDATDVRSGTGALDVVLVRYHDRTSTDVTGGENRHRTMVNHRVVHAVERLGGPERGERVAFDVPAPSPGEGCAVLVQDRFLTRLDAAALCPD